MKVPEILKAISPKLLSLCRLLPWHPVKKKPWLHEVIKDATNDRKVLLKWQRTKKNADWAIRLESEQIIVLDFDRPGKAGCVAGGLHTLSDLEAKHQQSIPRSGPMERNETGGQHWYFILPFEYRGRMKNWNPMFPNAGIDIRVTGGNVVIPPTVGRSWIRSFDEAEL